MPYKDPEQRKAYLRKRYQDNKELYKERSIKSRNKVRQETKEFSRNIRDQTPCADCGNQYRYWAMDFDHVRGEKILDVCRMVGWYSLKAVKEEIAKCDIVCAVCHRYRTQNRLPGSV